MPELRVDGWCLFIATCPEARESQKGAVLKVCGQVLNLEGTDYKGGEAVPRDPQCQEGGKLRVRLVKD